MTIAAANAAKTSPNAQPSPASPWWAHHGSPGTYLFIIDDLASLSAASTDGNGTTSSLSTRIDEDAAARAAVLDCH
jgi:hypothetical protein